VKVSYCTLFAVAIVDVMNLLPFCVIWVYRRIAQVTT
jgi:hypothetical protein